MKVLVVGNGGREHALAWKLAQSSQVEKVYVAPGNAGTALEDKCENVPIATTDKTALAEFALAHHVTLTIVGPEAPLVIGLVDYFESQGLACFGPSQAAAQLEGSKCFAKAFLERHQIPTASYSSHQSQESALAALGNVNYPIVIKADGLAAGKGVIIAQDRAEAEAAIKTFLTDPQFCKNSQKIILETFLQGEEASFIVMVDGDDIIPMATSQDHKRRFEQDRGPNTGGMGAYSPAPVVTPELHQVVMETIIKPTIAGLKAEGIRYRGFLYAGLMICDNTPYVLEFNCRFGDPETQPIMMRLQSDLALLCLKGTQGLLSECDIAWSSQVALGVVMAAPGYPENPVTDEVIALPRLPDNADCKIFHAGTQLKGSILHSAGGRVLCVTALGETIANAQNKAYAVLKQIDWPNGQFRSDIGYRALSR